MSHTTISNDAARGIATNRGPLPKARTITLTVGHVPGRPEPVWELLCATREAGDSTARPRSAEPSPTRLSPTIVMEPDRTTLTTRAPTHQSPSAGPAAPPTISMTQPQSAPALATAWTPSAPALPTRTPPWRSVRVRRGLRASFGAAIRQLSFGLLALDHWGNLVVRTRLSSTRRVGRTMRNRRERGRSADHAYSAPIIPQFRRREAARYRPVCAAW
jgi:hypothetical protein